VREAAVNAITFPSEYVYTGTGVLVAAADVSVCTAVVRTTTGAAASRVAGVETGSAVADGVAGDDVDIQPAITTVASSRLQTIPIRMSVLSDDFCCIRIVPLLCSIGWINVKLF
jgi:hypothetical protein